GISSGPFDSLNLGIDTRDDEKNIEENLKRFCKSLCVDRERLCLAHQEHSDNILAIKGNENIGWKNLFSNVDGFITNISKIPLMVKFADCQGVFMFDPVHDVISAVHCGWRGNVKNIIGKAVKKMAQEYSCNPSDILVGISPSLGPCCAEFSYPFEELPEFMHKYVEKKGTKTGDRFFVDLWQCSFDQLAESGILPDNIELAGICTVCENDKFFSYRGGKKVTGHMGGLIEILV
ncbi:peptidoglycan editing factor PgeF, partial [Candidatus Peregrinibacteria bacterium]|nr:peptidoglycan editing factor PgeF [Candidatus Peregrinibacteria bacterium]